MDKIKKFVEYNSQGKLELIDQKGQEEYLEKYINGDILLDSNMNWIFQAKDEYKHEEKDFVENLLKKYNIQEGSSDQIQRKKNHIKKNGGMIYTSLITTTLNIEELDHLFGKGIKTNELGEGLKEGEYGGGMCYFYKLNDVISLFFYDNRGSSFEVESEGMTNKKFIDYYLTLINLIMEKTEKSEQLREIFNKL